MKLITKKLISIIGILIILTTNFYFWKSDYSAILAYSPKKFTKEFQNEIYGHNFDYIHNPGLKICAGNQSHLMVIAFVCSSPKNFYQRKLIRQTWAQKSLFGKYLRVVFLLADPQNKTIDEEVKKEYEQYSDIVQENFIDSYRNLSLKTIMGFRWVTHFCPKAKYVLKIDDDVVVNTKSVIKYLCKREESKKNSNDAIIGKFIRNPKPKRTKKSKFYVSFEEYDKNYFYPYCQGLSYLATNGLAAQLFNVSKYKKPFIFEDVYVGMLAHMIGAKFESINPKIITKLPAKMNKKTIETNFFILARSNKMFLTIWNYFYQKK
ncbi:beta-1-3-galactosyltransferase 5-like [Brachionus plicatilis]|uniref:Hexosyltransferase n=1 Tax=Brachionus plicatilis TaxID=10195 RepID=A0A3M7SGP2_BRAPC|nr:beta-1-3-galactosyltransferase 5-like [Brachionus plicatilis]